MSTAQQRQEIGFTLTPGVWEVGEDVNNPDADKRYRNVFDAIPVWKEGTLVIVNVHPNDENQLPTIRPCGEGLTGQVVCHPKETGWKALQAALVRPEQNMRSVMAQLEYRGLGWVEPIDLLDQLLNNVVTPNKLISLATTLGELSEEQFLQWRKDNGR